MTRDEYEEWMMSEVISQLVESKRFLTFLAMNYDITQEIDADTQEARLQVIEVPHEVATQRIQEEAKKVLVEDADKVQVVGADVLDSLAKA